MKRMIPLFVLAALAAASCARDGGEAPPVEGQPAAAEAAPAAQDSIIFEQVMEDARAERLDTLPIGEVVARIAQRFVGAPYTPYTLERAGAEGLVVNLREFDCVTLVESALALARTVVSGRHEFARFRDELRRIRYRGGELSGYASRLHYFTDWIGDNQRKGVVVDLTRELGGVLDAAPIDFMSAHADAYRQLADAENLAAIRSVEQRLSAQPRHVIPERAIAGVASKIRNGDVIAATSTERGLDVAHTGIALWVDGRLHLLHAPLVGESVEISRLPLAQRIVDIDAQDGILVARPLIALPGG